MTNLGAEYTLGRVPIASTDFSPRPYSYAEVKDDFDMEHFSLVEEDFKYKVNHCEKFALSLSKLIIIISMLSLTLYQSFSLVALHKARYKSSTKFGRIETRGCSLVSTCMDEVKQRYDCDTNSVLYTLKLYLIGWWETTRIRGWTVLCCMGQVFCQVCIIVYSYCQMIIRFFEAYSSEGVDFWSVEVQNEPRCGADSKYKWQSMYFSPEMEAFSIHR